MQQLNRFKAEVDMMDMRKASVVKGPMIPVQSRSSLSCLY